MRAPLQLVGRMGGLRKIDDGTQPVLQCLGLIGGHRLGLCFVMFDDNLEAEWAAYSQPSINRECGLAYGKTDGRAIIAMFARDPCEPVNSPDMA